MSLYIGGVDLQPAVPAFVAVAGIVVGWALKEFSDFLRGIAATRKERRQALAILIRLYYEMIRIEAMLEKIKNTSKNWEFFEKFRQRYSEKYGDRSDQFVLDIRSSIRTASGINPWISLELEQILKNYINFKNIKIDIVNKYSNEAYILMLSTVEAVFAEDIRVLRKSILKISVNCGIIDFLKSIWNFKRRNKIMNTKSKPFEKMDEIFADVMSKLHDVGDH